MNTRHPEPPAYDERLAEAMERDLFHATLKARTERMRFSAESPDPPTGFAGFEDQPRGECDVCRKPGRLARCTVTGIETYACEWCRGEDPATTDPIERREWV